MYVLNQSGTGESAGKLDMAVQRLFFAHNDMPNLITE